MAITIRPPGSSEFAMPAHTAFAPLSRDAGWADLLRVVRSIPDMEIVGRTRSANEALQLLHGLDPDVMLAAPNVEDGSGLSLLTDARALCPRARIIVFARRYEREQLVALWQLGVRDYMLWSDLDTEGIRACLIAASHGAVVRSSIALDADVLDAQREAPRLDDAPSTVTEREREILTLVANGVHDAEIAKRLQRKTRSVPAVSVSIAVSTVETHVEHICRKLGAENRSHAVAIAIRRGVI